MDMDYVLQGSIEKLSFLNSPLKRLDAWWSFRVPPGMSMDEYI